MIIDADPQVRTFITLILQTQKWDVSEAETAEQAFEKLTEKNWALVVCDALLDGYSVLRRFAKKRPEARFVLMTGHGSAAGALDATDAGVDDYLVKPFSVDDVLKLARSVREQIPARAGHKGSKISLPPRVVSPEIPIIGRNPKFVECLKMVERVAATTLPVLITGESGTGKEIVARLIHQRSNRSDGAYIPVNCGAIPVELIESELFGHARGAFTGADRDRKGLWEEADGGTIFLDEITETNPLFQVKLLRALQEGEIRRVGSNQTIKVNVRVLAATNRNIEEEVWQGCFRQDLMYRLNAITIDLPPLRERPEDIVPLAEHFAAQSEAHNGDRKTFSREALEMLKNYQWSGNIRELENTVFHAVSLADDIIFPEHLPARILRFGETARPAEETGDFPIRNENLMPLAVMEAKYVAKVLAHTGGNKQAAARVLQIDRKTLSRIIARGKLDSQI